MKILSAKLIFFCTLFLLTLSLNIQNHRNWQLEVDKCPSSKLPSVKLDVTIPSTFHLDLLKHKKIDDPFFGDNYLSQHWVSECDISYSTNITFSNEMKRYDNIQLVFDGIDTYSTVYFNDKQMLQTKNAFIQNAIPIDKSQIKEGNNVIRVSIKSTKTIEAKADSNNRMPFIYAHTRKPCYQYSWDWAPYLNTMGLWKPVYTRAYNNIKIDYVWARNKMVSEHQAIINFAVAFTVPNEEQFDASDYVISVEDQNKNQNQTSFASKHVYFDMKIQEPKLWWPNGIGEPYIYDFHVTLKKKSVVIDERRIPYGIKTVKLDQKNNQFTVILNGYPVYCKGANYVPPDMFYPRLTNPDFKPGNTIQNLLNDCVESNFNMIRVWGGGQYESDAFLEMASRKGIMIFYDFMFSDSIYPSEEQFLINVEEQIKQEVRRVRNYPCLVLWSGNNEILQGIYSWGWGRSNYKEDYHKLFEWLIPEVLKKENPQIPYIASSPVNGVGNAGFNRGGDIHFWGVWAGGSTFQAYKNALGPFNSEFGTQALPVWETIKDFTKSTDRSYNSAAFSAHERHGSKFRTLQKYHQVYAHNTSSFQMEAYMSGLVQAFGIEIAIIYQRAAKPKSYGTLYWQLNDAWPAISWSSIDYYGRWKPLQYMAKRLYPNIAIFCLDGVVKAINDNLYPVDTIAIVKVMSFSGKVLFEKQTEVRLEVNQVKNVATLQPHTYDEKKDQMVVHMEIIAGRKKEMESTFFYHPFKDLKLPKAKLYVKYDQEFNVITVRTDTFIKNLFISNSEKYIKLSDNYFDLIANREVKVQLLPIQGQKIELSAIRTSMKYRGYQQTHLDEELVVIVESG